MLSLTNKMFLSRSPIFFSFFITHEWYMIKKNKQINADKKITSWRGFKACDKTVRFIQLSWLVAPWDIC